jgi:hypothetical protein
MSIAALTWLTIGACLVYVVAIDSNVYTWLVLLFKSAVVWLQRQWFSIRYNPDSPWVRWQIDRNASKMAKEFLEKYKQEQENGPSSSD